MKREVSQTVPPADDLDQLLGDFFRSEMPDPWPAAPVPLSRVLSLPPRPRSWRLRLTRSRLALVASVAVLLGGALLLGGLSPVPPNSTMPSLGPGDARRGLPLPTLPPETGPDFPPARDGKFATSASFEQRGDGPTGIKIIVEELPPGQ